MKEPLLSVIVPIYNVEQYLDRCIESIINQTYKSLEIILVDDGSTDRSGRISDDYASRDARIRVIHKPNGGLVSARKAGVREAKGEYIAHVDSDDWLEADMYSEMMDRVCEYYVDVVTCGLVREYGEVKIETHDMVREGYYDRSKLEDIIFPRLIFMGDFYESGINGHVTNKIIKSEIARKVILDVPDVFFASEDNLQVYPMIYQSNSIYVMQDCKYHYMLRDLSNASRQVTVNAIKGQYKYMRSILGKEHNFEYQLSRLFLYIILLKGESELFHAIVRKCMNAMNRNDRIIVYGAGKFGTKLVDIWRDTYDIIAWMDQNENEKKGIQHIQNIQNCAADTYDHVIIGAIQYDVISDMKKTLEYLGVDKTRVISVDHSLISEKELDEILEM